MEKMNHSRQSAQVGEKREEGAEEVVDGLIWGVREHVIIDVIFECRGKKNIFFCLFRQAAFFSNSLSVVDMKAGGLRVHSSQAW